MSDISDVANGLAFTIAGLIYPNGITPATGSITGRRTIIRRGWLTNGDYQGACSLAKGTDYVTVRTLGPTTQEVPADLGAPWRTWSITASTVALAVSGNEVTVSIGSGVAPEGIVGIKAASVGTSGALVAGMSATHVCAATDTAANIAAALAGQINGAYASGAVLTVPNALEIETATGGYGLVARVLSRQVQNFTVSVWSNSWKARDALGKVIVTGLMSALWFNADDGWPASVVKPPASAEIDTLMTQGVYRRDIQIALRFDTIETQTSSQMLFGVGMISRVAGSGVVLKPFGAIPPVTGAISDGNGTFYEDASGNIIFAVQQPYSGIMMDSAGNVIEDAAGNLAGEPS